MAEPKLKNKLKDLNTLIDSPEADSFNNEIVKGLLKMIQGKSKKFMNNG